LEDGSEFPGEVFGFPKSVSGEVVFCTGMTGYTESLTDPSYNGQILVFTYPLIGNYGVPALSEAAESETAGACPAQSKRARTLLRTVPLPEAEKLPPAPFESDRVHAAGVVVAEHSDYYSHWSAGRSLSDWLQQARVPGISGVDTRALTKKIRKEGTMLGKIVVSGRDVELQDPNRRNLVSEVSVSGPRIYQGGPRTIALVDCGAKASVVRAFTERGYTVIRCPWNFDFTEFEPDGAVISNGPGDPRMVPETVQNVEKALSRNIPVLGICLGSQILGLAAGARTYKLKYGHRGQNQPCVETGTRRCYITTQNHGYAVDASTLPRDWREWFYNNNDGTNEGIKHISRPFFGAQFHPEASPGPDDTEFIFDLFLRALE